MGNVKFTFQSVLTAMLIMFFCMAAGELLYDEALFRGFLRRPKIWPAILYWFFYWPREWRLTTVAAGLFFGWILPGTVTIAAWTHFSRRLFIQNSACAENQS